MKIDVESINFEADEKLLAMVNSQIKKLSNIENKITGVDVYLKSLPNHDQLTKTVEMRLFVPGNDLYAEHHADTFDEALLQTAKKMRGQILKRKDMMQNRSQGI